MRRPSLVIFATRYDGVTRRTHRIAQRLLAVAESSGIECAALFETHATDRALAEAVSLRPAAIAFYCHGDLDGRILAQDREPCWAPTSTPDLSGVAVFAHACRAMCWLRAQAADLRSCLVVGYERDLKLPANGSARFWEIYEDLRTFVARHLAEGADADSIRRPFYDLCTKYLHELDAREAGLMELVAVYQSRDEIIFA
jgi:hypothetical protein